LLDKAFDAVADDATWWVAGTPEPYTKQQYRDYVLTANDLQNRAGRDNESNSSGG
jgi:hypothetical protein